MHLIGEVKRVTVRELERGNSMVTYDILDSSVGRVQVVYYPEDGEVPFLAGAHVSVEVGEIRPWVGRSGRAGVSLRADSVTAVSR